MAHLIAGLPNAGAEMFLSRLVREGHRRGHEHEIVNFGQPTPLAADLSQVATVTSLNIKQQPWLIPAAITASRAALSSRVDITLCWMYYASLAGAFLIHKDHGVVVANMRHTPVSIKNETRRISGAIRLLRMVSTRFDCITYNSKHSREWHTHFGFENMRHEVIGNGYVAPAQKIEAVLNRRKYERDASSLFRIGAAARNHPMKNFEGLLHGFEIAVKEDPLLRLNIVGKGTEALAETDVFKRIYNYVEICGECIDMQAFYQDIDAFVSFSSWGESFQNVVAEAMLWGVPALCTTIGAADQIVVSPSFLLAPGDTAALAKSFIWLHAMCKNAPEDWENLCIESQNKISKSYSIQKSYDTFQKLCSEK